MTEAPDHARHGHHHHHGPGSAPGWTREQAVAVLESPERRRSLDPEAFWEKVGLLPTTVVAEVGAGTGYFALPAARRVGKTGKVYAVDISEELVGLLRERSQKEKLPQLVAVLSQEDRIPLPDHVADVVLFANVLHDVPAPTIAEAVRLLRPGGCFVNLDWKKEETPQGPPLSIRLSPAQATEILGKWGLMVVGEWSPGPHHYAQLLRRKGEPPRNEC